MFNIHYYRNANQNYSEVSPHASQNDHDQSLPTINVGRVWRKGIPSILLVGMQIGTTLMRNSMKVPLKKKLKLELQ